MDFTFCSISMAGLSKKLVDSDELDKALIISNKTLAGYFTLKMFSKFQMGMSFGSLVIKLFTFFGNVIIKVIISLKFHLKSHSKGIIC